MTISSDHPRVVVNPFIICLGVLALALAAQWLLPLPFVSPTIAHIVGAVVFLLGIAFGLPAARGMRTAQTTFSPSRTSAALVTSGRFQISRNPIYVAMLLNYAGLSIFFGTPWGLLLTPVVIWLMDRWVIVPEERHLEEKFGMAYAEYRQVVHRWL
jgi:protein-S-isoprenylcysteine O-methyltransferase Ste14